MLPKALGAGRRPKQAPTCSCVPDDDSELIGETSVGAIELEPHEGKGLGHDLLLAYQASNLLRITTLVLPHCFVPAHSHQSLLAV